MDRRAFLGGVGAAGLAAAGVPLQRALAATDGRRVNRVAVIGAGIVGASIAYNLAKRGCDVVLLDERGPAAQASGNSFAWINASYFDVPSAYFALRTHSLNEYHRLAQELSFPIRWGGSLEWYNSAERERDVTEGVRRIQQMGAPTWMIGKERVAEIEPNLNLRGDWKVAYCSRDGAVDPAATTRALVHAVVGHGGRTVFPGTVTGLSRGATRMLVETAGESFETDLAVVATGADANEIAAMVGLGTKLVKPATSGIIVTTRPMEPLINTVAYTTDTHFHQRDDGRFVLGEKAGSPGTVQHMTFLERRPNAFPMSELAMQHAKRVVDAAKHHVPQLEESEVENVGIGWRPLPLDGLPVVGRVPGIPGVYLASMHSGVTLAPLIGHLAAMEILDDARVDLLSDFRVDRLLS